MVCIDRWGASPRGNIFIPWLHLGLEQVQTKIYEAEARGLDDLVLPEVRPEHHDPPGCADVATWFQL